LFRVGVSNHPSGYALSATLRTETLPPIARPVNPLFGFVPEVIQVVNSSTGTKFARRFDLTSPNLPARFDNRYASHAVYSFERISHWHIPIKTFRSLAAQGTAVAEC
jgi:hypothetical protein